MRAVVVDPAANARLLLLEVEEPAPSANEAIVAVRAISLNVGETRSALADGARPGARPGWDFSGVVERAAADGSGPGKGARVVGLVRGGAWAEQVAAPADSLATLPQDVSFTDAATLPVAGLTAAHALARGGWLLGRKVLVNGAAGNVGIFACQLATAAGAEVFGSVRRAGLAAFVENNDASAIVVGGEAGYAPAAERGPYDLILDPIGGESLAKSLAMLRSGGVCVSFGHAGGKRESSLDSSRFYSQGGASLYGLLLFDEIARTGPRAGVGLACLASLVADRRLRPHVEVEAPWADIAEVARRLIDRAFLGKAVLTL